MTPSSHGGALWRETCAAKGSEHMEDIGHGR